MSAKLKAIFPRVISVMCITLAIGIVTLNVISRVRHVGASYTYWHDSPEIDIDGKKFHRCEESARASISMGGILVSYYRSNFMPWNENFLGQSSGLHAYISKPYVPKGDVNDLDIDDSPRYPGASPAIFSGGGYAGWDYYATEPHLGFQFWSERMKSGWTDNHYSVVFPVWFFVLILMIFPAIRMRREIRLNRRKRNNQCLACGYDLRASPGKCPECGTIR